MANDTASSLDRFRTAQAQRHAGFEQALAEVRAGGKRSHWIWYILPQLAGLGQSSMSRAYGIDGRAEAEGYLQDPVLAARYLEIVTAIADQLARGVRLEDLMGSSIDAQKLTSSLTLFGDVAEDLFAKEGAADHGAIHRVSQDVLEAAAREGYGACAFTRRHLEART
jgi:uncharacterized protein (DUF1810 family)